MAANWHPFIPENQGFGQLNVGDPRAAGLFSLLILALMRFPRRRRKRESGERHACRILGSLVICTVLYILWRECDGW